MHKFTNQWISISIIGIFHLITGSAIAMPPLFNGIPIKNGNQSDSNSNIERITSDLNLGIHKKLIIEYKVNDSSLLQNQIALTRHKDILNRIRDFGLTKTSARTKIDLNHVTFLREYTHLPMSFIEVKDETGLNQILNNAQIKAVYEDRINQLYLSESLPLINQPAVVTLGYSGAGTSVAILDTGVDYTRSSFGNCTAPNTPSGCKVVYAQDFATEDNSLDAHGHGTNVAGISLGVAPGTDIIALDVFDGGRGLSSDIINAINWVIANQNTYNIVAINMSLGGGRFFSECSGDIFATPIAMAKSAGILVAVAAGNEAHKDSLSSPACVPDAVSVGAVYEMSGSGVAWRNCTDDSISVDQVTCFSNSASFLDLLAPGAFITAAGITQAGTSQATPHVAGAAAILAEAFPEETVDNWLTHFTDTGVQIIDSNAISKPRIDLISAISDSTITPPAAADEVQDPGFEVGTPNPNWIETSTNFGTPICSVATCGDSLPGAFNGSYWAWFGGTTNLEIGALSQVLHLTGKPEISFYLAIPSSSSDGYLQVKIDGKRIFEVTESDATRYFSYQQVILDLSAFADDGNHTLSFESRTEAGAVTSFYIDDIFITQVPSCPESLDLKNEIITDTQVHKICGNVSISANVAVSTTGVLQITARDSITISPEFIVESGSSVSFNIDPMLE